MSTSSSKDQASQPTGISNMAAPCGKVKISEIPKFPIGEALENAVMDNLGEMKTLKGELVQAKADVDELRKCCEFNLEVKETEVNFLTKLEKQQQALDDMYTHLQYQKHRSRKYNLIIHGLGIERGNTRNIVEFFHECTRG